MPKRQVVFAKGEYYHIYNRGANRLPIFHESENYRFLLPLLKQHASALDIPIVAYCLMPNHYHLLVRQDGTTLAGKLPQAVFHSYVKAFNKRYQRTGTLFEGPYKAIHIDRQEYLVHLCRYIHGNPVKDGIVSSLDQWPYSNYLEWIGKRAGTLFDPQFVEAHFSDGAEYREFVHDYLIRGDRLPAELNAYTME